MTGQRRPKLRVVGAEGPPAARKSPFDDIETLRASTRVAFEAMGARHPKRERPKRQRLARSTDQEDPFSRVWFSWFGAYPGLFSPLTRLWLVLWYRSREGTEPIQITQALAKEARIHLEDGTATRASLSVWEWFGLRDSQLNV